MPGANSANSKGRGTRAYRGGSCELRVISTPMLIRAVPFVYVHIHRIDGEVSPYSPPIRLFPLQTDIPEGSTRSPARASSGRPRYCSRKADQGTTVVVMMVVEDPVPACVVVCVFV